MNRLSGLTKVVVVGVFYLFTASSERLVTFTEVESTPVNEAAAFAQKGIEIIEKESQHVSNIVAFDQSFVSFVTTSQDTTIIYRVGESLVVERKELGTRQTTFENHPLHVTQFHIEQSLVEHQELQVEFTVSDASNNKASGATFLSW